MHAEFPEYIGNGHINMMIKGDFYGKRIGSGVY